MKTPFHEKRILLGVTGSIAAYKAVDLASKLTQEGAQVDVLLTQAALRFVTPLTFQSVTGRRSYVDQNLWGGEGHVLHIGLAREADLFVIAPATAQTMAKMAQGLADNLLTVTALAVTCPILIAPAMDGGMYQHPATQANLDTLRARGATVVGPAEGHLASGQSGIGRMLEPIEIMGRVRWLLGRQGPLRGRKVVVTAGGTQEAIDPVRMISNTSSGKQGFALAQAAIDQGADVQLIAAPVHLTTPIGVQRVDVISAEQMLEAVTESLPETDVLIMAAAVSDFRPAAAEKEKIKKESGIPQFKLEKTPDILHSVSQIRSRTGWPRVCVGFAAETQDLVENARVKLEAKKLDLIVANDINASDAGFSVDTNRVTLLFLDGRVEKMQLMSKTQVANGVVERVIELLKDSQD